MSRYVLVTCLIRQTTDKAIAITQSEEDNVPFDDLIWVPRSLLEYDADWGDTEISVQRWFADKKDLEHDD